MLRRVEFIGHQQHWHVRALQFPGHHHIGLGRTNAGIHDEDDHISGIHGDFSLPRDVRVQAFDVGIPAAGVLHPEALVCPFREIRVAVAGNARDIFDDGFAAPQKAVGQRGFADVRATDDRYRAQGFFYLGATQGRQEFLFQCIPVWFASAATYIIGAGKRGGKFCIIEIVAGVITVFRCQIIGIIRITRLGQVHTLDNIDDALLNLLKREFRGIHDDRIRSRTQRRGSTRRISCVTTLNVGKHSVEI